MNNFFHDNVKDHEDFVKSLGCSALAEKCKWVAWKKVRRGENVTKPPIDPKTGQLANIADPMTGTSYQDAASYAKKNDCEGIGFILRGDEELTVIDLDDCVTPNQTIEPWVKEILDCRETYAEFSPSGNGIHIIAQKALEKAIVCAPAGVEVYGRSRYLTFSGNPVPGSPQTIARAPLTLDRITERVVAFKDTRTVSLGKNNSRKMLDVPQDADYFRVVNNAALQNLVAWVPDLLPAARTATNGYRVASFDLNRDLEEDLSITEMGIKDFGVADQGDTKEGGRTAIDLVIEYASNVDIEMVSLDGLKDGKLKTANASNAIKAAVWLARKLGIDSVSAAQNEHDQDIALAAMNEKYFVAPDGGKTIVVSFQERLVGELKRFEPVYQSFEDFSKLYQNRYVIEEKIEIVERRGQFVTEKVHKPLKLGKWWLDHPKRRQYEGITFEPNQPEVINGSFNMWRGFAVPSIKGDWSLIREHIKIVLADGNDDVAEWIINWIGWCVQNPHRAVGTAVVLKGGKGTGKSVIGNLVRSFFGQHGLQLSSVQQFVGNFNSHLRDACFVFLDEAFWGGDKANDGQLKRLITEPDLFIEAKHRQGITVTNMLKIMMASNERWVVPATQGERRYAVFNVSGTKQGDRDWFDNLLKQIQSGGAEAMLYDLLHMDLKGFNPRIIPVTPALLEQQEEGLSPLDAWFRKILNVGVVPGSVSGRVGFGYTQDLLRNISESSKGFRSFVDDRKLGDYLKGKNCKSMKKSDNRRGYEFPPLQQLRQQWEALYPGTSWDDSCSEGWGVDPDYIYNLSERLKENGVTLMS
jgi:hypothetical protein